MLALRGSGGTRERRHTHWLKGLLWCHRCGHRMIIERGKGNGGIYFYFFCRGRKAGKCDLPYLGMAKVEAAVDQHFATLRLSADFITTLRAQFSDAMKFEQRGLSGFSGFKKRLNARLAELDTQEDHFLDLVGDNS